MGVAHLRSSIAIIAGASGTMRYRTRCRYTPRRVPTNAFALENAAEHARSYQDWWQSDEEKSAMRYAARSHDVRLLNRVLMRYHVGTARRAARCARLYSEMSQSVVPCVGARTRRAAKFNTINARVCKAVPRACASTPACASLSYVACRLRLLMLSMINAESS